MGKYDFIILYEHRKRELENAVLLAMMLEKKGYKVAIEYRRSAKLLFQKTDVLIMPFFYNDENVVDFTMQPIGTTKKVINLQYEQVFTQIDEGTGKLFPHESAINAVHIAWGKKEKELMLNNGINPKNIYNIGHISMDLNSDKYRRAFYSKKGLSKKYSIPLEKKWHLFISSFSFACLTDAEMEKMSEGMINAKRKADVSNESQKRILDLYEEYLKNNKDTIVIYRPHPAEISSDRLKDMERKFDNFRCIPDLSIRQWIRSCDSISTWQSTSLADAYFAKKKCAIIRPIEIIEEDEFGIFKNQKFISGYEELENFINGKTNDFDIDGYAIKMYYSNSDKADTFEKLVDICEKVRNTDEYAFDYKKVINFRKYPRIKYDIFRALMGIASIIDYSKISPSKYTYDVKYTYNESKGYKKEIAMYRKRFSRIKENNRGV